MIPRRLRFPDNGYRGRRYPEPPHPYRNEFQRDRDRIVHARAFRRLEDKTQVFGAGFSDHFRNRLTHTIEVAQIARTLAGTLGLNEDFTETLALAHDIGHPPFAHAGEDELNRQMQLFGESFDHNLHALHIVEHFEQRYARFPGLNLTLDVCEGMAKHSRDIDRGAPAEYDDYLPGLRPPLEAQLIDLADECAYNTADLDDGYAAGLFSMDEIAAAVPYYQVLLNEIREDFPHAPDRLCFQEIHRRLIDHLVSGLIHGTAESVDESGVMSVDEIREYPQRLVRMTSESNTTNSALKRFLHARVYSTPALLAERDRAAEAIARLFHYLLNHPDALPATQRDNLDTYPLHRVVCHYIAGMTDGYFRRTEQRLLA